MFSTDEAYELHPFYLSQQNLYTKLFSYILGALILINLVRSQISEVNLVQLIPGFYLLLLLLAFLFLIYFSYYFFRIPYLIDTKSLNGTKVRTKQSVKIAMKSGLFLFLIQLSVSLNSVVPISLECFNSYGEKTLENQWSLLEVVTLEIILLTILLFLSQFPAYFVLPIRNELLSQVFSKYWKKVSFFIILFSGFLTPTIDGYTQLSFAFSTLFLYFWSVIFSNKRMMTNINFRNSLS